MLKLLAVTGLTLTLAACASEPRREHRGDFRHHGGPGEHRMGPRLFISPSGEPFRERDGLEAWFDQADANHDGVLTEAEFQADALRFFKVVDLNGDGVIDGLEAQNYEQTIAPEISAEGLQRPERSHGSGEHGESFPGARHGGRTGRDRDSDAGGRGERGEGARGGSGFGGMAGELEGAARYSLIDEPEPIANADSNVDGKVTLREWRAATARRFATLDKAKTGQLTLAELKAARSGDRGEKRHRGRR